MLFMVVEHFHPGMAEALYRRFRDRGRLAPPNVRYVASWVDVDYRRCYQVMEAESEAALKEWTVNWENLADFDVVPVLTSEEAAKVIAPRL